MTAMIATPVTSAREQARAMLARQTTDDLTADEMDLLDAAWDEDAADDWARFGRAEAEAATWSVDWTDEEYEAYIAEYERRYDAGGW